MSYLAPPNQYPWPMSQPTIKGKTIREYCRSHPDLPHLTLAKIVYRENPKLYANEEVVRRLISYHRGATRNGSGKYVAEPIEYTGGQKGNTTRFQYRAPKTEAENLEDVYVHGAQRVLRLSDIHYPFHDPQALEAAVEYGMKHDPTILLLGGDIMDCHDLSVHDKDPRDRYTETELRMIGDELKQFRRAFPKARIIWQEGNHEQRLKRYLQRKAPELWGLPMLDIPGLVNMVNGPDAMMGVEWVDECRTIHIGHLAFLHGHEFRGGGGVNPARWLFLRTGENALCGHFHRTSEHSEPTLSRKQVATWTSGCLCEMRPAYLRNNKWNHGFMWIDVEQSGKFRVKNIRVMDGKIY